MILPSRLVWVDLETTGLDPATDKILELAIVVTDEKLREVAARSWVVQQDVDWRDVRQVVQEMHTANGLIAELEAENGLRLRTVECEALELLDMTVPVLEKGPICGSSPHFDMAFLRSPGPEHDGYSDGYGMFDLAVRFNHRVFDVSTLKLGALLRGQVYDSAGVTAEEPAHRALADIRGSIKLAKMILGFAL